MQALDLNVKNFCLTQSGELMLFIAETWHEVEEVIVLKQRTWFIKADELLVQIYHSEPLWQELFPIVEAYQTKRLNADIDLKVTTNFEK